jgi:hypothetical protein
MTAWRPEPRADAWLWRALAVAAMILLPGHAARAQQTAAADHFVDSVGVNVHLHYEYTPYKENFELIRSRLIELGVRHVRDGLIDTRWQGYYDRHNELGDAGIKGTFITGFDQSVELLASYPSRVIRSFEAYEAPNEADKTGDPNWVSRLWQAMLRLGEVKRIASVAHYPVVGPSLTSESSYAAVGDVSAYFDAGNLHNYLAGRHPGTPGWGSDGYGSIAWNLRVIQPYSCGKPITTTEIGYQNHPTIEDSVPADVAGRYLPRVLLEQYRMGITRTFLYELCDFPNSGSYGLLNADGSPKPAFNAVRGLLRLLADPGPPIALRPLAYQLDGSGTVRHIAFQKRDGTYFLALWLEEASYDVPVQRHTAVAGQAVSLTLPEPMRVIRAHRWEEDGSVDDRPVRFVAATLPVGVSDRLTVLEIADANQIVAPPGAPAERVVARDAKTLVSARDGSRRSSRRLR